MNATWKRLTSGNYTTSYRGLNIRINLDPSGRPNVKAGYHLIKMTGVSKMVAIEYSEPGLARRSRLGRSLALPGASPYRDSSSRSRT
jgi:hypothetical protein